METFFKLTRAAPRGWERALEFIEVRGDGAVTRIVFEDMDGELLSKNVAILSHTNGAFSEAAYGNPNISLWDKSPPDAAGAAGWAQFNCTAESISRAEFERLFRQARPNINLKDDL